MITVSFYDRVAEGPLMVRTVDNVPRTNDYVVVSVGAKRKLYKVARVFWGYSDDGRSDVAVDIIGPLKGNPPQ